MRNKKFWKVILPFIITICFGIFIANLFLSSYKSPIYNVVLKNNLVFTKKPIPTLTEEARINKIEGTVTLKLEFNEEGKVRKVETLNGLPYGLTEKAITAALETEVEPLRFLDRNYSFTTQINYNFTARK